MGKTALVAEFQRKVKEEWGDATAPGSDARVRLYSTRALKSNSTIALSGWREILREIFRHDREKGAPPGGRPKTLTADGEPEPVVSRLVSGAFNPWRPLVARALDIPESEVPLGAMLGPGQQLGGNPMHAHGQLQAHMPSAPPPTLMEEVEEDGEMHEPQLMAPVPHAPPSRVPSRGFGLLGIGLGSRANSTNFGFGIGSRTTSNSSLAPGLGSFSPSYNPSVSPSYNPSYNLGGPGGFGVSSSSSNMSSLGPAGMVQVSTMGLGTGGLGLGLGSNGKTPAGFATDEAIDDELEVGARVLRSRDQSRSSLGLSHNNSGLIPVLIGAGAAPGWLNRGTPGVGNTPLIGSRAPSSQQLGGPFWSLAIGSS